METFGEFVVVTATATGFELRAVLTPDAVETFVEAAKVLLASVGAIEPAINVVATAQVVV